MIPVRLSTTECTGRYTPGEQTVITALLTHVTDEGPPQDEARERLLYQYPSVKVCHAVLAQAVGEFVQRGTSVHNQRLYQDAKDWLLNTDGRYVFSCANILRVFEIDPVWFRQGIRDYDVQHPPVRCLPQHEKKRITQAVPRRGRAAS